MALDAAGDSGVGTIDARCGSILFEIKWWKRASVGYDVVMLESRGPPSEPRGSPNSPSDRPQELTELPLAPATSTGTASFGHQHQVPGTSATHQATST